MARPFLLFLITFISVKSFTQPRVFQNGEPTLQGNDLGNHLDTPTRAKIDLSGVWSYTLDGEKWMDVRVPSAFDFEGKITFQRKFFVGESLLTSSVLKVVALGINNDAEVYVNETFIGKHAGGYTQFEFEIPENAMQQGGENVITVVVNNQLSARSTLPVRKQVWGWRNYGGILRNVYLLATPRLWIQETRVQTDLSDNFQDATLRVTATVSNNGFDGLKPDTAGAKAPQVSFLFNLELYNKLSEAMVAQSTPVPLLLEANHDHEVLTTVSVHSPKLWSPDTPDLYILKASVVMVEGKQQTLVDQYARNVGFRQVVLDKDQIVVNGKKTSLRGVVWHEDSPEHGGSLTYEQMEKDIALVKTLSANAVRFAFHPPHPYVLNLCARYGLLALVEIPVWNVPGDILADESFQSLAEMTLKETIQSAHDNPSVIAWGIGADFDSADPRAMGYVARMAKVSKSLDSRPVYFGSRMIQNDVCVNEVDFAAVELPTADLKTFRLLLSDWEKKYPTKPVLLLGYGKEVDHHNRNGWSDPMSQEAQARFFLQYYGAVKDVGIAGSFVSSFADWRGDRPILTTRTGNPYIHPVGLLSYNREKRLAYDMVKVLYGDEKTSAIPVGNHRSSFPVAHVIAGLVVMIVGGYQYAYNRRFGEAVKRAFLRSFNFYSDLRDLRAASVLHTLTLASLVSVTLAVMASSILYHYRSDKFFDYALTYLIVSDRLKELLIRATWNLVEGIVGLSVLFFVASWVLAVLIKLPSVFIKTKIQWFHAYSVSVWGALPIVFLSPIAMSLFKIMENQVYVVPSLILIVVFAIWTLSRVLAGLSVIYDISGTKAYAGGLFACAGILVALYLYYDSVFAISSYFKFLVNVARSLG